MNRLTSVLVVGFAITFLSTALIAQGTGNKVGQNGVTAPSIISKVDPKYTEAARKEKIQGTVLLEAMVEKEGTVRVLRVVRGLGYGLDESAIDALSQWKFNPGTKDGKAVDVDLNIEVNFNLEGRP